MLRARDVTVRFGGLVAVDEMSLEVRPGEVVGLIGPNGAGKTTLLAALGGQMVPHGGRVLLDDRDITEWAPERRSLRGVARTFQRLELFRKMTVLDNLRVASEARYKDAAFIADLMGRTRWGSGEDRARAVAARLGLEDVLERWADELPTGLGRLVEIGRALCTRPRFLLLDEPAGGLDEEETGRLASLLRALASEGPGVLVVEHDLRMVMDLCDRVVVMDFGRRIGEGTPEEIRGSAAVREAYLGEGVIGAAAPGRA